MSRALKDGESRQMRSTIDGERQKVAVIAHRVDSDSPVVILRHGRDGVTPFEIRLTDYEADDLIDRLKRALRVLPTSK